ncbi:MAG: hypothetical protein DRP27_09215 [Thermotogae bacterium]|nr:MAG: hypothetical protein DRP27_09215 [Thermotogota bacterium]
MRKTLVMMLFLLLSCLALADSGFVMGGSLSISEDFPQVSMLGVRLGWANLGDDEMLVDVAYRSNARIEEGASPVTLIHLRLHFSVDLLDRNGPAMAGFYADHERTNLPENESTELVWNASTIAGIELGGRFENFEISARVGYPLFSQTEWSPFDTLVLDLKTYFISKRHNFRDWLLMGVELEKRRFRFYVELVEPL